MRQISMEQDTSVVIPGLDNEFPETVPEVVLTQETDPSIEDVSTQESSTLPEDPVEEYSNHSGDSGSTLEQTPEYVQRKLYFLLEHLKQYHEELPESYQVRIPHEILSSLANCLLNDTIFEIVKGLMEIQHVTENHLSNMREQITTKHKIEIQDWVAKIQDTEELEHILALMKIKHNRELKEMDKKLVLHLDQKVRDQQSTLNQAGVPGYYVTDNPKEIKIQMHLLDFILRLSRLKFDAGK